MLSYREVFKALVNLQLPPDSPVIVHGSLSAFEEIRGGAETVIAAICATTREVMFPAFTYKTMIIPGDGPADNAITYGSGTDLNLLAEYYTLDLPVDPTIGILAERFRQSPHVNRSFHPILSFSAINMDVALLSQTLMDPFAPIEYLYNSDGWVLLLGVDHTVNTSIHYAEKLAGRKQFTRWGLIKNGVVECPGFPGCSDGFNVIAPMVENVTRKIDLGVALIQAVPVNFLVQIVKVMIDSDPQSLLCDRVDCERCNAVRQSLSETLQEQEL
jgi:aminoglycoside 3-N-acetyltransferase